MRCGGRSGSMHKDLAMRPSTLGLWLPAHCISPVWSVCNYVPAKKGVSSLLENPTKYFHLEVKNRLPPPPFFFLNTVFEGRKKIEMIIKDNSREGHLS